MTYGSSRDHQKFMFFYSKCHGTTASVAVLHISTHTPPSSHHTEPGNPIHNPQSALWSLCGSCIYKMLFRCLCLFNSYLARLLYFLSWLQYETGGASRNAEFFATNNLAAAKQLVISFLCYERTISQLPFHNVRGSSLMETNFMESDILTHSLWCLHMTDR